MAIQKPTWLENVLSWLNWDILTFRIHVGQTVEDAIDWVITWLNIQSDLVTLAQSKAEEALVTSIELDKSARTDYNLKFDDVYRELDLIDAEWSTALSAALQSLEGELNQFITTTNERTDYIEAMADNLSAWWDYFRTEILPILPSRQEVQEVVEARAKELEEEQLKQGNIITFIYDLITAPRKFFRERLDDLFDVIIENLPNLLKKYW